MQDKNVIKLTDQDAALLEQGASILEGLENDERNRGNCSTAEGAGCSAHAVRRLASALLAHEREIGQCLHQIQEPSAAEQAAWHAGLDEGRAQAAPAAVAAPDERQAFEIAIRAKPIALVTDSDGDYKNLTVQLQWEAWQARAALAATPAAVQTHAEAAAALGINSALTRIRAGNHAEAIEPLEHALRALAASPSADRIAATITSNFRDAGWSMPSIDEARVLEAVKSALSTSPAAAPVVLPEPEARSVHPTFMTDDQASAWAWADVRKDVGTENWTTGDSCNFYGFFLHGWNYRAQYERQRAAAMKVVEREIAAAPAHPAEGVQAPADIRATIMGTPLGVFGTGIGDIGIAYRAGHRAALLTAAERVATQAAPADALATGGLAQQPAIMPKGESAAAQLRAMATNYPPGHSWDKLDAKACIRGALEIEALRALLATATGLPAQAVETTHADFEAWWGAAGDGRSKLLAKRAWTAATRAAAPQAQADARDADGEAFRTAARLGLTLRFYGNCAQSGAPGTPSVYEVTTGPDSAEAMRASIDRAAIAAAKGE